MLDQINTQSRPLRNHSYQSVPCRDLTPGDIDAWGNVVESIRATTQTRTTVYFESGQVLILHRPSATVLVRVTQAEAQTTESE